MPLAECRVLWREATRSKVLKVLNFSGAGKTNIFNFRFTGGAAEGPDLATLDRSPCGDNDVCLLSSRLLASGKARTRPMRPGTCGKGKGWNALASLGFWEGVEV